GFVSVGDSAYFFGGNSAYDGHIWRTQGVAASTAAIHDLTPGLRRHGFDYFGSGIVFTESNSSTARFSRIDGAGPPVELFSTPPPGAIYDHTAVGSRLFFRAGSPLQEWRTDGTLASTVQLTNGGDLGELTPS